MEFPRLSASASPLTSVLPFLPRNARPEPPKRLVNLESLDEDLRDRGNSLRPAVEPRQPDVWLRAQHESHRREGRGGLIEMDSLLLRIIMVFLCVVKLTSRDASCYQNPCQYNLSVHVSES